MYKNLILINKNEDKHHKLFCKQTSIHFHKEMHKILN